jgi:hypothetical protein
MRVLQGVVPFAVRVRSRKTRNKVITGYLKITIKRCQKIYYLKHTQMCVCQLRYEGAWGSGCIDPRFVDIGSSRD